MDKTGKGMMKVLKDLIKKGNETKVVISNDQGDLILKLPMTLVVCIGAFAPFVVAFGFIFSLIKNCKVEFINKNK
jgi:hypothetical protein